MKRLVFGVGINDADYPTRVRESVDGNVKTIWCCPYYRSWTHMIERCYSKKLHAKHKTYSECTVMPEWFRFSVFREWMSKQDWKGKQLDKDVLSPGNKLYSPETCVFVDSKVNSFLTDCGSSRGKHPIGVSWDRRDKTFRAQCRNPFTGKNESLGYFSSPESAHEAWRTRKHDLACQYAEIQNDPRVATALRNRFAKQEPKP